ncbi:hypothetical protein AOQ72_32595 [Bradyrhizobium yuanmingense]|uniref:YjiS-like domain-containing protein n=1 Tax=Bradyrhizobium yuanmingense TaxID=108015 RepID=A0A0R3C0L5_9BRAD|nr:DUF1127 domain-containing protein [Bradyrhizobium yuanmingense]KRP91258.1 hypothetical protein AOQ72_32595 [Bradyrhizobium yuanmingense]
MSTIHSTTWLEQAFISTRSVSGFIWKYWNVFRERRERKKLRAAMSDLCDRELADIGTTRGEVDYFASRGMRFGEWLRYLPTADGQIGPIDLR